MEIMWSIISGALFVIGIIAGIGPQNLNTINHAILRNYHYHVAFTCFIADSILILIGGTWLSITKSHIIINMINLIGVIFISWYLLIKLKALFQKHQQKINPQLISKNKAILRALALTWLNPLVFIDTIIIIGGNVTHYVGLAKITFLIGAILGDFIWLFGLSYLASYFSYSLNKNWMWVLLDLLTIVILIIILYKMAIFLVI